MLCFVARETNLQIKCGRSLFLSPENLTWKPSGAVAVFVAAVFAVGTVAVGVAGAVAVAVDADVA